MESRTVSATDLIWQLAAMGVQRGGVLVVHTAFKKVGAIENGPQGLIDALVAALGPGGTLVMPSMADTDDEPFDPDRSPCRAMGVVADTFWRMPGVSRSDSPHAFAARGPRARDITAPHSLTVPHGRESPVGRVYDLDGAVLLLGVGHDADTTIHLAENIAGVRYRLPVHSTIVERGRPVRVDYSEVDHCCENFRLMDGWLDERQLQRRGIVGHADARLARSRAIVAAALERLRRNETIFLHPPGVCRECDASRASL
jgi:aminoglycoside N3'-acetyltransferase